MRNNKLIEIDVRTYVDLIINLSHNAYKIHTISKDFVEV